MIFCLYFLLARHLYHKIRTRRLVIYVFAWLLGSYELRSSNATTESLRCQTNPDILKTAWQERAIILVLVVRTIVRPN